MKSDRRDPVTESLVQCEVSGRMVGRRELIGGGLRAAAASAAGMLLLGPAGALAPPFGAGPGSIHHSPDSPTLTPADPAVTSLLANIQHGDNTARQTAVLQASLVGTTAISALAKTLGSEDPSAAKAALAAIQRIVHNAARPGAPDERQAAASHLLKIASGDKPFALRGDTIRLLGVVGGPAEVTALSDLLHVPSLREDARMALERIPDPSAETALKRASRTVPVDYRAAIAQSLRHRKTKPREVGLRS